MADVDPDSTPGLKGGTGKALRGVKKERDELFELHERLYAERKRSLLVVLQGMDTSGKDGTVTHVVRNFNPQGVLITPFKAPTPEERRRGFLWRMRRRLPQVGFIGIFNRSHYEEVVVVRVHPEILEGEQLPAEARGDGIWERRYRQINDWERFLVENGFPVAKVFLNLSKEEQRRRFLRRIDFPEKNWKFKARDVRERAHWDEYQAAFSEMLSATSTEQAPWYVIPADHKWFMRVAVAAVLVDMLAKIDPQYPTVDDEARKELAASKQELEAQAPDGVAADPVAEPAGKE